MPEKFSPTAHTEDDGSAEHPIVPPSGKWEPEQPRERKSKFPPELEPFVPEAEAFIERHRELFYAIARDRSLTFTVGNKFVINLKSGKVSFDVKDWKMMRERGFSEWQIVWSACHELAHFHDLRTAPEEMLANFEYMERRAKELEPRAIEIFTRRWGKVPEHLTREYPVGKKQEGKPRRTMTGIQIFFYKKIHLLYNSLDDMYVNGTIGNRTAVFRQGGSQEPEIERLYRDYLFATDPKAKGKPPEPLQAADYAALPKSYQYAYALLRKRMVPGQEILVHPDVRAALEVPSDAAAARIGLTREREVNDLITNPANRKAQRSGWRYERIKQAVEPAFVEFLMADLEQLPPPPPPKAGGEDGEEGEGEGGGDDDGEGEGDGLPSEAPPESGDGESEDGKGEPGEPKDGKSKPGDGKPEQGDGKPESGEGSPWDELNEKPEPIDLETVRDFIAQQAAKAAEERAKERERDRGRRLTPEQRDRAAQAKTDAVICGDHGINPALAQEYRALERSVAPYEQALAAVFEQLMRSIEERLVRFIVEGFRSGKFNVERFITKYGADIAADNLGAIPWDALDVYDQRELMSRLSLYPNRIRLRLVLDGSGSMKTERVLAVKQLAVLFMRALSAFEATVNLRFRLKEPIMVDTEVRMFGDRGKSKVVKTFQKGKPGYEDELADRFAAIGKIHGGYGYTYDDEPFEEIAASITPDLTTALKSGRAKEFAFEATDGGSSAKQETRNAVEAVEQKGAVARGFQIGTPDKSEIEIFDEIWGEHGARVPHPKDLAPAAARVLADEIRKITFQIQYYEVEDEE